MHRALKGVSSEVVTLYLVEAPPGPERIPRSVPKEQTCFSLETRTLEFSPHHRCQVGYGAKESTRCSYQGQGAQPPALGGLSFATGGP